MGFLKTVRKSKSLLSKSERGIEKTRSAVFEDDVKERVQHKAAYFHDQRSNSKRKRKPKMKYYIGAISSKPEESENARVYTFSSSKYSTTDEDCFTVSTTSASSDSSTEVESECTSLLPCNHRIEGINLHQISRSQSTESLLSSPSSSDHSTPYDIDLRDDLSEESIANSGNRDIPDFDLPKGKQTSPPLLSPPRQYVADDNICSSINNSLLLNIPHNPNISECQEISETKNKLLSIRDVRRHASEGSRDYVHVFRQPLVPLDEELTLYDSGNDADDDSSEQSASKEREVSRRGSLNSSDDEHEFRQRWEYGLAMMAKMGINNVVYNHSATLNAEVPINTLSQVDCAYDEIHEAEI